MESKYFAAWKPNDRNVDFWNEVLVHRQIRGMRFPGSVHTLTIGKDRTTREYVEMTLDSGEVIYLDQPDLGELDAIAPAPAGPVGQFIRALDWDEKGIVAMVLEAGRIVLYPGGGRMWIEDGTEPRAGTPEPVQKVEVGSIMQAEDERFFAAVREATDKRIVDDVNAVIEANRDWAKSDDEFKNMYATSTPPDMEGYARAVAALEKDKMVGWTAHQLVAYEGGMADALRGAPGNLKPSTRMVFKLPLPDGVTEAEALAVLNEIKEDLAKEGTVAVVGPGLQIDVLEVERTCQTCGAVMIENPFVRDMFPPLRSWTCPVGHVEEGRGP